jgi:hypothetical protein
MTPETPYHCALPRKEARYVFAFTQGYGSVHVRCWLREPACSFLGTHLLVPVGQED